MKGKVAYILLAAVWAMPLEAVTRDLKSAKPRTIEVQEEVWVKKNEDLENLRNKILRLETELRVSRAEIVRLEGELEQAYAQKEPDKTYSVREGDNLWKISRRFYNDPYKWLWVFKANMDQITDPDQIYPKQVLEIPRY
ncbi:MAG: LysM peptidoglycan-binding domain-containing protein [Candidatus Omnitrophica bacterium]|nr:LysM peptidoglycan-binding domain-containing protein [Candidatus Omnitrophota bacterium]